MHAQIDYPSRGHRCGGRAGVQRVRQPGRGGGRRHDGGPRMWSSRPTFRSRAPAQPVRSTNKLIQLYLEQIGSKAGDYNVTLKTYDDSTAAKGAWDDAACAKNATDHVANDSEVAVMGTFNSGCAKIEVPTLNQDSTGPMLMVSHANTNPGLTKTWETGEPDKYYPTGTRNYARVVDHRRLPGPGRGAVRGRRPEGQEGVRAQRQPDLRSRRGQGLRRLGQEGGHRDRRRAVVGRQAAELHRPLPGGQGLGRRHGLPRRHLRQQRRPADQGQGRRARATTTATSSCSPRTASPATRTC